METWRQTPRSFRCYAWLNDNIMADWLLTINSVSHAASGDFWVWCSTFVLPAFHGCTRTRSHCLLRLWFMCMLNWPFWSRCMWFSDLLLCEYYCNVSGKQGCWKVRVVSLKNNNTCAKWKTCTLERINCIKEVVCMSSLFVKTGPVTVSAAAITLFVPLYVSHCVEKHGRQ